MVERSTGGTGESQEEKERQDKLCDIDEGRARIENLVSRAKADEPIIGGEKKSFVKLSECDQLIDLAPVIVRDLQSRITLWTSGDQQLYGYNRSEAVGKVSHDLLKTVFPVSKDAVDEALEKQGSWHGELTHTTKDGGRITVASRQVLYYEGGKAVAILEVNNDVTGLKRGENALAEQATKLQEQAKVIDLAHVMIRDMRSRITLWTDGDEILYGYTKEEALGKVTHDLFKTVFPVSKEAVDESLGKTGRWQGELTHTAKDGHKVVVASHQVLYREYGKPVAILEVNNDITEQKQIFKELYENRELLARSQEVAHLGSWIWYIPENRQIWSDERYRIYGLKPGEIPLSYEAYLSFVHPDDRPTVKQTIDQALHEGKPFNVEYRIIRKDGAIRHVHSEGSVTFDNHHRPVKLFAIGQDITERKQAEEALKVSETKYRIVADNTYDWEFWQSPERNFLYISPSCQRFTGYSARDFASDPNLYYDIVHPGDRERFLDHTREVFEKRVLGEMEFRIVRRDGAVRWMHHLCQPVFGELGEFLGIRGSDRDITERKLAEDKLKEAKAQAELYLDIMGHDINNLNQVALTNLDLIKGDENLTEDQNETLADALNSVKGSAAIIDNVRKIQAIAQEKPSMQPEDLDEIIKECVAEAPKPAEYTVKINYSPRPGSMVMGTTLLKEVFNNLIANAIKHAGRDVTIDIRIDEVVRAGKKFYEVSIADNGPGIPDALKPKLFARFQRGDTKAHGKGLGLFIVKSLVETVGGNVTVEDRVPGDYTQGARFIVSLPASEGYR